MTLKGREEKEGWKLKQEGFGDILLGRLFQLV